ncbi:hypothetical protein ACOMHN_063317 [Nucella lapillus]
MATGIVRGYILQCSKRCVVCVQSEVISCSVLRGVLSVCWQSQEWETSSSSEDEDSPTDTGLTRQGQLSAAKFVLRRTRKDLNTLSKEVVKGR